MNSGYRENTARLGMIAGCVGHKSSAHLPHIYSLIGRESEIIRAVVTRESLPKFKSSALLHRVYSHFDVTRQTLQRTLNATFWLRQGA